jgi:hypothetical protein
MTAWTTPRTYTANEVLTKTIMDTHVRDNLNYLFEQIHSGSSTAGWASFTPSIANLTTTSGTLVGKKAFAGRTTLFYISFTFGASSAVGGSLTLTLPETSISMVAGAPIGQCTFNDAGTGFIDGMLHWATTTTAVFVSKSVSGSNVVRAALSSTAPFTWATGDTITALGFYERAS